MADALMSISPWSWLALGLLLLVLETFGAAGYLLWIGLSAGCVGLLAFLLPSMATEVQLVLFGLLAVLTAVLCWRRQRLAPRLSDQPTLNQRSAQLVGLTFTLVQPIKDGRGQIKVGDSLWTVSGPDLPLGARVNVISHDGLILQTEHVPD